MTTIRLGLLHPTVGGTNARSTGSLQWVPTARRVVGPDEVLPEPFYVTLSAAADVTVDVAPTTSAWVWQVLERVAGGGNAYRYLVVPDSLTTLDYASLVEVDPATLDPITAAPTVQTLLDAKAPLASPAFTGTPTGITKAHVGLGSVDNTADSAKPVSTAQAAAIADEAALARNAANLTGTIPDGVLPVTAQAATLASTYERTSWRVVSQRGKVGSSQSNGTDTTQKSRTRWVIRGACSELQFVFSNFFLPSGAHETANPTTVTVTICVEDPTTSAGDIAGAFTIPVFFGGKRGGILEGSGILISDPVAVNIPDGGVIWLRSSPAVASGGKWVNALTTSYVETPNVDGSGVSEGMVANDSVIDSGTIAVSSATNVFGPTMILGRATHSTRKPSVLIAGDSIAAETNIVTMGDVSYMTRACMLANYATTRISEGGERLFQIIAASTAWKRWRLARHCTHVLSNYGTNDIYSGRSLAQLQADLLTMATMWQRSGLKVFQLTILPRPGASTDGYMSVAGQSITSTAYEAVRTGFNDWLLDTSASGAKAQSGGALTGVLDPCATIEVNAAGVLTHNGGFWTVPGGSVITGTATGYTTTTVTDSTASRVVNADIGKILAITSATTGAGQAAVVTSNTATTWTLMTAITLPTGTATYQIGASYFVDGTHPSEQGHDLIGNALSVSAITL